MKSDWWNAWFLVKVCCHTTRWWFKCFFSFHPYLGKIPILTNIFQMGWNHQLDNRCSLISMVLRSCCFMASHLQGKYLEHGPIWKRRRVGSLSHRIVGSLENSLEYMRKTTHSKSERPMAELQLNQLLADFLSTLRSTGRCDVRIEFENWGIWWPDNNHNGSFFWYFTMIVLCYSWTRKLKRPLQSRWTAVASVGMKWLAKWWLVQHELNELLNDSWLVRSIQLKW